MLSRSFVIAAVLVTTWISIASAQSSESLTGEQRSAILDSLRKQIDESYLFPERASSVRSVLDRIEVEAAQTPEASRREFGRRVTMALREETGDKHFAVAHDPVRYSELEALLSELPDSGSFQVATPSIDPDSPIARRYRDSNYFFREASVLAGNIGYIKIDQLPPLELAKSTVDAALAFIANTDAVILDLQGAPGGFGGFIPYLMSYFFPSEPILLYSREFGAADSTIGFYTHETIGGVRRTNTPLFILVDERTGSAAENLAYTLQQHGRAIVVGGVTAGGAHSATMVLLGHGFIATIPVARVVHPISQANWEGDGVQPDVMVEPDAALFTAHNLALDSILESEPDPQRRGEIESARQYIDDSHLASDGGDSDSASLEVYAGRYGPRSVFLEDGVLTLQRDGGPALPLVGVGDDEFRFDLPPGVRSANPLPNVLFLRDSGGAVVGLAFIRTDGSIEEEVPRDQ